MQNGVHPIQYPLTVAHLEGWLDFQKLPRGSLGVIWAEARVDARVEVAGRQQAVGAAHAGRSRAIRSSHGRAWLLSRRVRSRGWVPTQNEPPACRKPRSAESCWCGGGVGRPIAWLPRSNRLAEAWSCMHPGPRGAARLALHRSARAEASYGVRHRVRGGWVADGVPIQPPDRVG